MMKYPWDVQLLARLIIPVLLVPLLGISPSMHIVSQIMFRAKHSMNYAESSDLSMKLARLVDYVPWRHDIRELAAFYALESDDHSMALKHFQFLEKFNKLSGQNQITMGDAALLSGDLEQAIDIWNASLLRGGSEIELLPRLYNGYKNLGNIPSQIEILKSLVNVFPSNPDYHYQLGLFMAITHPEISLGYFLRAAELDPQLSTAVQTIQRNYNSARLANDPVYVQMIIGRTLASLNEWEFAHEAFTQVTNARPDYAEGWAYLGESNYQLGKDGFDDLQKSLDLNPKSTAANTFMAIHWQRQGRYEMAYVYLYAAIQSDPLNPVLQVELGNTLAHLGDINEALIYYQRAIELSPRDPTYWQALARFSIKYEYDIEMYALEAMRQALLLNPEDAVSLDLMGQIYIRLDDTYTAERFLVRSLEVDPNYAPAHLHLGFVHLLRGHTQSAFNEFQKARILSDPGSQTIDQADRLLQSYFLLPPSEQH
jgi:tetratricopeptide (TPR) repeat protein